MAEPEIFNGFAANSLTPFTKTCFIFNIYLFYIKYHSLDNHLKTIFPGEL